MSNLYDSNYTAVSFLWLLSSASTAMLCLWPRRSSPACLVALWQPFPVLSQASASGLLGGSLCSTGLCQAAPCITARRKKKSQAELLLWGVHTNLMLDRWRGKAQEGRPKGPLTAPWQLQFDPQEVPHLQETFMQAPIATAERLEWVLGLRSLAFFASCLSLKSF